jgi:hypothetical protein
MITMRRKLFSDMMLASRDGSLIEVRHGPNQEIALTRWSGQGQLLAPGPNRRVNPVGNGRVALCGNRSPGTGSMVEPDMQFYRSCANFGTTVRGCRKYGMELE